MNLFERFNHISNWNYYPLMGGQTYEEAAQNPIGFINNYFGYGGKADFLLTSVYENNPHRATHVVNTYFLGLYLMSTLSFLKPTYDLKDGKMLWAWFLCALYHDAFFDADDVNADDISYDYCQFTQNFLYSPTLLKNYFDKNANPETSYDGGVHLDHGIVSASKLYKNYVNTLDCAVKYCDGNISDFFTDDGVKIGDSLKINHETFALLCKIAKVIACHNVFICADKASEQKYRKAHLEQLIVGHGKFYKTPRSSNSLRGDFEKLYYLLCLTDTLEPSKRGIDLNEIDLAVECLENCYSIDITGTDNPQYLQGIKDLEIWLNGITVKGKKIEIQIHSFDQNRFLSKNIF